MASGGKKGAAYRLRKELAAMHKEKPEFIAAYDELAEKMAADPAAVAGVKEIIQAYDRMSDGLKSRDG